MVPSWGMIGINTARYRKLMSISDMEVLGF